MQFLGVVFDKVGMGGEEMCRVEDEMLNANLNKGIQSIPFTT